MKEMKEKGFTHGKIAKIMLVTESTICYHLNENYRKKAIARAIRNYKKRDRREYQKKYQSKRYNNDPEYRERVRKDNRDNKRRKRNGTK